jgi:hypothetical protein
VVRAPAEQGEMEAFAFMKALEGRRAVGRDEIGDEQDRPRVARAGRRRRHPPSASS